MAFDATNFSSRKLQGRRFTGLANDSQEAFTQTFDLQSVEVLTDDRYIPTSSLPYSGSSQHEHTVARSYYDNSIVSGSADDGDVLKYFYRHKLTRATGNDINRETFYFLKDEPASAATKVNSDLLVTGSQFTNFINNKNLADNYAVLGSGDAEDIFGSGLAYNVVVFKSTDGNKANLGSGDVVDAGDYVFDYKTGILNFTAENAVNPDGGEYIYMTAYRYVGRTLSSQIQDGSIGGSSFTAAEISGAFNETSSSLASDITSISSSLALSSHTASVVEITDNNSTNNYYGVVFADNTGSGVSLNTDGDSGYGLTYNPSNNELRIGAAQNRAISITAGTSTHNINADEASDTINLFTTSNTTVNLGTSVAGTLTIGNDSAISTTTINGNTVNLGRANGNINILGTASIDGDLIVTGQTTQIQTVNLNVEDQFLLVNSGSNTLKDGGIIVSSGPNNSGSAFYYDADANRWSLTPKSTTAWNDTSETPKQYVVTVSSSAADPLSTNSPFDFGNATDNRAGMMHVNTDSGDIWIYS